MFEVYVELVKVKIKRQHRDHLANLIKPQIALDAVVAAFNGRFDSLQLTLFGYQVNVAGTLCDREFTRRYERSFYPVAGQLVFRCDLVHLSAIDLLPELQHVTVVIVDGKLAHPIRKVFDAVNDARSVRDLIPDAVHVIGRKIERTSKPEPVVRHMLIWPTEHHADAIPGYGSPTLILIERVALEPEDAGVERDRAFEVLGPNHRSQLIKSHRTASMFLTP